MKIYLAGGFRGTIAGVKWQEYVKKKLPYIHISFLDPSTHPEMAAPSHYTAWDLIAVRNCDVVLAYMEVENPAGWALAMEIGYAHALGKPVLLVDEKSKADPTFARYFAMIVQVCIKFDTMDAALNFLEKYPS